MDLISIIIPIYKVERYLRRCVESVLRQSYENIEIILVDDGSPDSCPQICEEFKVQDSRILVIHKENGGLSDARNAGLKAAHGDYIMFVDSDDYIHHEMVEALYNRIVKDKAELGIINFEYIDELDRACKENAEVADGVWRKEQFWQEMYSEHYVFCVVAWNKIYRAELFEQVSFPKGKLHEDEFVLFDIIKQCQRISVLGNKGYFYLQREDGITGRVQPLARFDAAEACILRALCLKEEGHDKWAEKAFLSGMGSILQGYLLLDGAKKEKQRYKEIKRMYNNTYFELCSRRATLRFKINAFTFVLGPEFYILTHDFKVQKRMEGIQTRG